MMLTPRYISSEEQGQRGSDCALGECETSQAKSSRSPFTTMRRPPSLSRGTANVIIIVLPSSPINGFYWRMRERTVGRYVQKTDSLP